jgi:serine phosphatase RsbU (regulator of sigma subunit)
MLYALCERQSSVELLASEVVLAQRCQGGIRSEMDRIHEELHLAAAIQRDFTSAPLPKVDGLEFGVLFRPVNFVSGDIYNVRPLGDGCAAFFLADAVGHGVPAALLTMVLTSSLTTTEHEGGAVRILEPREVLERLNARLCQSCLGSGRFATALYGVIDSRTRKVRVAGAGHPWPLVISKSGATELAAEGPLLGVFPDGEFTQAEATLTPGQTLLLYTDGFEALFPRETLPRSADRPRWSGREYINSMSRLVGAAEEGGLTGALQQIGLLLDEQSGSLHQSDDITALAIAPMGGAGTQARPLALKKAA